MSNRRVPLSNVPNGINSPFRAPVGATSKRSRAYSTVDGDAIFGEPPLKKKIVEVEDSGPRTPTRKHVLSAEGRVFNQRPTNSQPTAFDRKLLAVKDKSILSRASKVEKQVDKGLETVRQWQEHYRKAFPSFVFYFESIPEDVRKLCARQIVGLGAREEKFFSKEVTHIVTSRAIPPGNDANTSTDNNNLQENCQPRTIDPSLLEKSSEQPPHGATSKSKFTFDTRENGKAQIIHQLTGSHGLATDRRDVVSQRPEVEVRMRQVAKTDILRKAKDMGTKIWPLEKFDRIVRVICEDADVSSQVHHGHNTRSNMANTATLSRSARQADLSHLIRNEQLNGPSDRESALTTNELIPLKGPYIFIRDINERTKPVMVREYPRVSNREEGVWPQFRSVSIGKCPFVEEKEKKDIEREKALEQELLARAKEESRTIPRTRAVVSLESTKMYPPLHTARERPLAEVGHRGNSIAQPKPQLPTVNSGEPSKGKIPSPVKGLRHFPAGTGPGFYGGEPTASGLQQSNITSAIRSQMISSTAAAPGAKAGMSKEVNELKRKVLEKNSGPSLSRIIAPTRDIDVNGSLSESRGAPPTRLAKQKAQERLGQKNLVNIREEETHSEEDETKRKHDIAKTNVLKASKGNNKDTKPGYCENCREKFDSFDEHVVGRKHRKFALTTDNWKELDGLLADLVRPLREDS